MTQEERFINGELLRLRREERGWVISDMALRACMSVKQIKQLEEGGTSAFYSEAVKLTAARKAATVLGLPEHDVFAREPEAETPSPHKHDAAELDSMAFAAAESTSEPAGALHTNASSMHEPAAPAAVQVSQVVEPKSKTSLWTIVGLFVVALAVAAYLQPQEEEATEAAPPLQVVPEVETAVSGAEPAASAASVSSVETPASAAVKTTASPAVAPSPVATTPASAASRAP